MQTDPPIRAPNPTQTLTAKRQTRFRLNGKPETRPLPPKPYRDRGRHGLNPQGSTED